MKPNREQQQADALDRAENGQSLANYPAIYEGFMAKGIDASDIKPRENVFTFNAWKAKGRIVKKGEHGVKVVTFVEGKGQERDPSNGEVKSSTFKMCRKTTVFHISQTELTAERTARQGAGNSRRRAYRPTPQVAPMTGCAPMGFADPGELAADRWNETHR